MEIYSCEKAAYAAVAAPQSRLSKGWFVGRRSAVSSSSALRASSCRASPRARATRSATSQVGLATPRSSPRIDVGSRSAESARDSCVIPISSRRNRMARPRATWGLRLIRTPGTLGGQPPSYQGTSSRYSSDGYAGVQVTPRSSSAPRFAGRCTKSTEVPRTIQESIRPPEQGIVAVRFCIRRLVPPSNRVPRRHAALCQHSGPTSGARQRSESTAPAAFARARDDDGELGGYPPPPK
jgi:hypothetical protein